MLSLRFSLRFLYVLDHFTHCALIFFFLQSIFLLAPEVTVRIADTDVKNLLSFRLIRNRRTLCLFNLLFSGGRRSTEIMSYS